MTYIRALALRVQELLVSHSLTLQELADLSGQPVKHITNILLCRGVPNNVIDEICKALNMEISEFYNDDIFKQIR